MTDVGVSPSPARRSTVDQALSIPGLPAGLNAALSRATESMTDIARTGAERIGALTQGQERSRQALQTAADQPMPTANLQDPPNAPNEVQNTDPTRVFGQILPVIAMLGGAAVKGDVTAALRAGTAAMKAAKDNDTTALQQAHQQWVDHLQAINAQNQVAMERLSEIRDNRKMSWDEKLANFTAWASETQSEAALMAAQNGEFAPIIDFVTRYQHAQQILATNYQRMQTHNDNVQMQVSREEDRMHNQFVGDPIIKPYLQTQQWFNHFNAMTMADPHNPNRRILRPEFNNGTSQLQLKDSATRIFTNQAIREFMMHAMDESGSGTQRVEGLMNALSQGGGLGAQQMQQLIDNVDAIHEAMKNTYDRRRAGYDQDAQVMRQRYGNMFDPERVFRDTAADPDANPQTGVSAHYGQMSDDEIRQELESQGYAAAPDGGTD